MPSRSLLMDNMLNFLEEIVLPQSLKYYFNTFCNDILFIFPELRYKRQFNLEFLFYYLLLILFDNQVILSEEEDDMTVESADWNQRCCSRHSYKIFVLTNLIFCNFE